MTPSAPVFRIEPAEPYVTLAAVELNSIAQGVEVLDAILKEAPVRILAAAATSPGKYLILFTGEVDEARRSLGRALRIAKDTLIDDLLLPSADPGLREALAGPRPEKLRSGGPLSAVGVIETFTAPSLLGAADTALKTGDTRLCEVHLLRGIGGKATAILAGDVESVRVAVDAGAGFAGSRSLLARRVIIPRPDPAIFSFIGGGRPRSDR